jgi:hypothetical protein
MLRRMVKRKEIRVWEIDDKADWFLLNDTPKKKLGHYKHEVAAADWFASYFWYLNEHKGGWIYEPKVGQERADRGMKISNILFVEQDMCEENIQVIYEKIDQYVDYAGETGRMFHVVFDFSGEQKKMVDRVNKTLKYAATKRRNSMFYATAHPHIENRPFEPIFLSTFNEFHTINQLLEHLI